MFIVLCDSAFYAKKIEEQGVCKFLRVKEDEKLTFLLSGSAVYMKIKISIN